MLNIKEEELSIDTNTSRAMQQIVRGLNWQPGDEFVMTSLEHVSTYGLSYSLTQEHGVTVKVLEVELLTDEALLAELAAALNERTRLICLSHIASPDGRLLPIKEAAAIAHDAGVPVMLDLAQSVGQMPVDLAALGCDFAVGSGHKWLLGPMGTGYIFVAEGQMSGFRPNLIPDRSPWALAADPTPASTARSRTEIGTYNHALVVGLGRAVEIVESIGPGHHAGQDSRSDATAAARRRAVRSRPHHHAVGAGEIGWHHLGDVRWVYQDGYGRPGCTAARTPSGARQGPVVDGPA